MGNPGFDNPTPRPRADTLLAKVAFAWIVPAVLVTVEQLLVAGKLTPVVVGLDTIAAFLLPFGLVSLIAVPRRDPGPTAEEDEGENGGGGGPPRDLDPPPPSGGLDIDWDQFAADVEAYAKSREVLV